MQAGSKTPGPKGDINVTPLVDVVLVLLIIFMVITPMLSKGHDVELPKVENPGSSSKDGKDQVTITVDRDRNIWLETDLISEADLAAKLREIHAAEPGKPIFVKGDVAAEYGRVRAVMKIVTDAGFDTVGLITKDAKEKG